MEQTTEDALLDGRLRFRQPAQGYRAAIDPVLLAAALPAGAGDVVLDAGCGAGAAALCLAWRVPGCRVVGVEIDAALAALTRDNAAANELTGRVDVVTADLAALPAPLARGSFDAVMTNPPFLAERSGTPPPDAGKARAHVETSLDLAGWIDACARRLKPRGWLAAIHRGDRIDELIAALAERFGAITVVPLWPRTGHPAKRVLVLARKAVLQPAILTPGLVLHEDDGSFTAAASAILRRGAPLTVPGIPESPPASAPLPEASPSCDDGK